MTRNHFIVFVFSMALFLSFACRKHGSSAPPAGTDTASLPRPDHIVILVEENQGYHRLIGAADAPFINQLAKENATFTQSFALTHPSQPNYIALFSGSMQGVRGDECLEGSAPFSSANLGASLIAHGFSFKGYAQGMPSVGFTGCLYGKSSLTGADLYARKHCPWVNWQGHGTNNLADSLSRPFTDFPADFSTLPVVSFVIPDMDHDMHNYKGDPGPAIRRADDWLRANLSAYIDWAKTHNSLFILTFDEDDGKEGNQIFTVFAGQMVKPGQYSTHINHYNVLRTIERMYLLERSGSATEKSIDFIWKN